MVAPQPQSLAGTIVGVSSYNTNVCQVLIDGSVTPINCVASYRGPIGGDRVILFRFRKQIVAFALNGGVRQIEDWDLAIAPGDFVSDNIAVNAPSSQYLLGKVSVIGDSGGTLVQEVFEYARGANGGSYKRMFLSGAWTNWIMVKGQPTRLTANPGALTHSTWHEISLTTVGNQGALLQNAEVAVGITLPFTGWYGFNIQYVVANTTSAGRRICGIGASGLGTAGPGTATVDYRSPTAGTQAEAINLGPFNLTGGDYSLYLYQDEAASQTYSNCALTAYPAGEW